jgi:hypothetical protein
MDILLLILLFMLLVSGVIAYFISGGVRKRLLSTGSPYAKSISVITFILCLIIFFVGMIVLTLYIFPFHR